MTRSKSAALGTIASVAAAAAVAMLAAGRPHAGGVGPDIPQALRDRAARDGRVRVIVELNGGGPPHVAEGLLSAAGVGTSALACAAPPIGSSPACPPTRSSAGTTRFPISRSNLTPAALASLESSGADAARVVEDAIVRPVLADSVPLIQGDEAWAAGYDGTGTTIAIVDSGVDSTHPFLAGKVVEEACYSTHDRR